ncbi:hypothetical protein AB0C97_36765 [Streptomyces goshikiensis]|uniref:hypothetical protein n=1 Tax=Streptomyces goshikiensis TaxID=1942 RepID=UPI0033D85021
MPLPNTAREQFIQRAREYAARNPEDLEQAAIIRLMTGPDPAPPARPPLNLAAARARLAARAPATPPQPAPAPKVARHASLNVGAARRRTEADRAAARPPIEPPFATTMWSPSGWRWVSLAGLGLGNADRWSHLAASLAASSPFASISARMVPPGALGRDCGRAWFRQCPDTGTRWVEISIEDGHSPAQTEGIIRHELAHIAEVAAARDVDAAFTSAALAARGERFAVAAEEWLTHRTPAAELLAAARDFETTAGPRRAR